MSDEPPAPDVPITPPSENLRANLRYVFFSVAGSLLLGVMLPVLLVCWHSRMVPNLASIAELECVATPLFGPAAAVLSGLLFKILSNQKEPAKEVVRTGIIGGAVMSFLNFPSLLVGVMFSEIHERDGMFLVRLIVLFAVSGGTCVAWTGWQVFRSAHRDAPFFPRFGLATLLGVVIAWAVLLAIFAPSSHS